MSVIRKISVGLTIVMTMVLLNACKKKGCTDPLASNYSEEAQKDDGNCIYPPYTIPSTYSFTDANGNNTVNYAGQTDRLNQLREMVVKMKAATSTVVTAQALKDMFANTNGDGNGLFSFSCAKQLKDKCFPLDVAMFETWMDQLAAASLSNTNAASSGQAGVLTTGTSTYLFDQNGVEYAQLIEKGIMGAVFMYQALNVYFSTDEMSVDNSTPVDPSIGEYFTLMEHHFDEAFGYFGVQPNFPTSIPVDFWGKYCNSADGSLNSNGDMMTNFKKGRAALSAGIYADRDAAIVAIQNEWEAIAAHHAINYLNQAIASFGTDNAKFLHTLSEAYAFAWVLRYAPDATRNISQSEHAAIMALFPTNFWTASLSDLNAIKTAVENNY